MKKFQPVIKWSGSKRSQCDKIVSNFPKEIDTYYEPFVGGGSVMRMLLESDIKVKRIVCSDLNNDLIDLWQMIKSSPETVIQEYAVLHILLSSMKTEQEKKEYYEHIRKLFNKYRNPILFLFLLRTCYNGLVRYNQKGEFNSPFHLNRNGINHITFGGIVEQWSKLLNERNVEFRCCSYEEIKPKENDLLYLDPPYANTNNSMYLGGFDNVKFFDWLREAKCSWFLSYDGKSGEVDNTYNVPEDLYDSHIYIESGNSSFKRLKVNDKKSVVYESLYFKV